MKLRALKPLSGAYGRVNEGDIFEPVWDRELSPEQVAEALEARGLVERLPDVTVAPFPPEDSRKMIPATPENKMLHAPENKRRR